jgi:hypothetical protein
MLTVATVYTAWKHGDWMDAYITDRNKSYQVLMIQPLGDGYYHVIAFKTRRNKFYKFITTSDYPMWIEEGINGVAA